MTTYAIRIRPSVESEFAAAAAAEACGQFQTPHAPDTSLNWEPTMIRIFSTAPALVVVAALLTGCMTQPKDLDLSLDKKSAAGVYHVTLVPPEQTPAINQMHSWRVRLKNQAGAPVPGARFAVDGGMPQHGHGLPTQPRITREIEVGTYQLDGMKFSMTGWWEVKLGIQSPQGFDKVTFNTVVKSPPLGE